MDGWMNKLMMDGQRGTQIDGWIKESMSKWIDCGLMAEWMWWTHEWIKG